MLGVELRLFAVAGLDDDLARRRDSRIAHDPFDLVLLKQERDAVDVGRDGVVLVLHHRRQIELGRVDDDAERGEPVGRLVEHLGGIEQRLGGNAADVQARAAERLALLDDGDLHAELRGADRADIAARAGAEDNEIVASHDGIL